MNTTNWHNVKMVILILAIALTGVITALTQNGIVAGAWTTTVLSILAFIEHAANGNTTAS